MSGLVRGDAVVLARDVRATLIPQGSESLLFSGSLVSVVQALGGAYTIAFNHQWFWIHEEDVDALGAETVGAALPEGSLDERIWAVLSTCYDPEIPVDIVSLGLIYDVRMVHEEDGTGASVEIAMTLTAPSCGMGPILMDVVKRKLSRLPGVTEVVIHLVFDPPWTQERMSDEAKLTLGLL